MFIWLELRNFQRLKNRYYMNKFLQVVKKDLAWERDIVRHMHINAHKHRCFLTLSYACNPSIYTMEKHLVRFLLRCSRYSSSHFKVFAGYDDSHAHILIVSDFPIDESKMIKRWKWGIASFSHKNDLNDIGPLRNATVYIKDKHANAMQFKEFCPNPKTCSKCSLGLRAKDKDQQGYFSVPILG